MSFAVNSTLEIPYTSFFGLPVYRAAAGYVVLGATTLWFLIALLVVCCAWKTPLRRDVGSRLHEATPVPKVQRPFDDASRRAERR